MQDTPEIEAGTIPIMADSKNPLKPVPLRVKPPAAEPKVSPAPKSEKAKPPANPDAHVVHADDRPSQSYVRRTTEGVEINLEQAFTESKRIESEVAPSLRTAPKITSAPPTRSTSQDRVTLPPPTIPTAPPRTPGVSTRNTSRRPCSFPGMLKVLLPEQSFDPQVFAVRVMDLSATGARVETRQLSEELYKLLSLDVRFIRLEILIPARERLVISGKLAWTEFEADCSVMGISFHPPREDLTGIVLPEWRPEGTDDSTFISPPVVDSYPPSTTRTPFTFSGHALDADEVVVRGRTEQYRVPVINGRFEVTVPLVPGAANELIFVALVGEVASEPTPVWIIHRTKGDDTAHRRAVAGLFKEAVVENNGRALRLKFKGDSKDLLQALRRLEETAPHGEEFEFTFEMGGEAERALAVLKKASRFPWGSA